MWLKRLKLLVTFVVVEALDFKVLKFNTYNFKHLLIKTYTTQCNAQAWLFGIDLEIAPNLSSTREIAHFCLGCACTRDIGLEQ